MAFEASKTEWQELCLFFYILAEGGIWKGNRKGTSSDCTTWLPIDSVMRKEHDGERVYQITDEGVVCTVHEEAILVARTLFGEAAQKIMDAVKKSEGDEVESPEGVEEFLDWLCIFDLQPQTQDRTDLRIRFKGEERYVGLIIRTRMGRMSPLLDGGRSANLKLELLGRKMSNPEICNINSVEKGDNTVAERIHYIEYLGGTLKYCEVAEKIFRSNLAMIDLQFGRILACMVRYFHEENISSIKELTEWVECSNPLKVREEAIVKNGFYRYKVKQFLMALLSGMRAGKIYTGECSMIEGLLLLLPDGKVLCYRKDHTDDLANFLYENTRLEKGVLEKDKYGELVKENGKYYFRLNVKVGFTKR